MLLLLAAVAASLQGPPPDTLTLDAAIRQARQGRAQAALARAAVGEARAAYGVAGLIPNPVATYTYTGSDPSSHLALEQRLDWLVRRPFERGATGAGIRGAEADSVRLLAELVREVRLAYFRALAAAETRRVVQEQGRLADSLATLASERVEAGDISILERQQLAVEAGRVRQLASQAAEAEAIARAALVRALNDSTAWNAALRGPLDLGLEAPWPAAPESAAALPTLRRALADSARLAALAGSAAAARVPVPSFVIGREWDAGGPFANGSTIEIGFALPLPLWNIGSAPAALARERARSAAALAGELRLDTDRRLREGVARLVSARERAVYSRDSLLPEAMRLRAGVVRLYRAGQTGVLPVFEALRAERDVQLGQVKDLLTFQEALADWLAFLGNSE